MFASKLGVPLSWRPHARSGRLHAFPVGGLPISVCGNVRARSCRQELLFGALDAALSMAEKRACIRCEERAYATKEKAA